MENIFKVKVNKYLPSTLEIKKFSGGETQVTFHNPSTSDEGNIVELFALIRDGDVMPLALVVDAIRRDIKNPIINLHLPYLPYARQDRVMNKGESLAVKVYCDFINSLNFHNVKDTCHAYKLYLLERWKRDNQTPTRYKQPIELDKIVL